MTDDLKNLFIYICFIDLSKDIILFWELDFKNNTRFFYI